MIVVVFLLVSVVEVGTTLLILKNVATPTECRSDGHSAISKTTRSVTGTCGEHFDGIAITWEKIVDARWVTRRYGKRQRNVASFSRERRARSKLCRARNLPRHIPGRCSPNCFLCRGLLIRETLRSELVRWRWRQVCWCRLVSWCEPCACRR